MGLKRLNLDRSDAQVVEIDDRIAASFEFGAIARRGNALQDGEHDSGESLESFIARKLDVVFGFEVADIRSASENHRSVVGREVRLGLVVLVLDAQRM